MNKLPTYLYRYKNSKNYFFRMRMIRFPQIDYHTSASHFTASLRTGCLKEAQWLALFIKNRIDKDIKSMQAQLVSPPALLPDIAKRQQISKVKLDFKALINERFQQALRIGKQMLFHGNLDASRYTSLPSIKDSDAKKFISNQTSKEVNNHVGLLEAKEIELFNSQLPESAEVELVQLTTASTFAAFQLFKQLKGFASKIEDYSAYSDTEQSIDKPSNLDKMRFSMTEPLMASFIAQLTSEITPKKRAVHRLNALKEEFMATKIKEVGDSMESQYNLVFNIMFQFIPASSPISAMNDSLADKIRRFLIEGKYEGIQGKQYAAATINKYLVSFSAFGNWCVKTKKVLSHNPFEGLKVKETSGNTDTHREFSDSEVHDILDYQFQRKNEASGFQNDAKWFAKVATYTGLRLNEVAVIDVNDVRKIEGVWCIDLRNKKLKTKSASRLIPIHDTLLHELGFLNYVKKSKKLGKTHLFEEIRKGRSADEKPKNGWGECIGSWFNRTMLRNLNIDKTKSKKEGLLVDFHSYRATVIGKLIDEEIELHVIQALMGHSNEDCVTLRNYRSNKKKVPLKQLHKAINIVNYS